MQSASNRILKAMNRKYTIESYLEKIAILKTIPDLTLSTDIIVGFPGETDQDFQDTMNAIRTVGFNEAFMYHYNTRPGTPAEIFPDQVPEKIKKDRLAELIAVQRELAGNLLDQFTGRTMPVLLESVSKKEKSELLGRTHNNLTVFARGSRDLIGRIIPVEITGKSGSGLKARICD